MKRTKVTFFVIMWTIVGILYAPIFILAWLLKPIARLLLAISYFGLLDGKIGKAVFKSMFKMYSKI